jgi:hypothetical protein
MVPAAKELASRLVQKINDGSKITIPPYRDGSAVFWRRSTETATISV